MVGIRTNVTPYIQVEEGVGHLHIGSVADAFQVVLVFPEILFHHAVLRIDGQEVVAGQHTETGEPQYGNA